MTSQPDDPFEDPEWVRFADDVRKNLIPQIKGSAVTMALCTVADPDPKQAIEIGYMVLLDKPIIAVVLPGAKVSNKLAGVADAIVKADMDNPDETSKRIAAAIKEVAGE